MTVVWLLVLQLVREGHLRLLAATLQVGGAAITVAALSCAEPLSKDSRRHSGVSSRGEQGVVLFPQAKPKNPGGVHLVGQCDAVWGEGIEMPTVGWVGVMKDAIFDSYAISECS